MLLRERVITAPTKVLPPQGRPVRVEIWAVGPEAGRSTDFGTSFYLAHSSEECTRSRGVPLPLGTTIKVDLEGNQELWAISSNEGFIGITILKQ